MAIYKVNGIGEDGKYMDDNARHNVLEYCMSEAKTSPDLICGYGVNPDNAELEMTALARNYNNDEKLRLRHSELSFSTDELSDYGIAYEIAKGAVRYYGSEYQIIGAVHKDTEHIHIHFVMNSVSYMDGHKYHGERDDYHNFLKHLNSLTQPYGIAVWSAKN